MHINVSYFGKIGGVLLGMLNKYRQILYILLVLTVNASCGSNSIQLDEATFTVFADKDEVLLDLWVEIENFDNSFTITKKSGFDACNHIKLDSISENYIVIKEKRNAIFPNFESRFLPILPNTKYRITNDTYGDAYHNRIEFHTDENSKPHITAIY